MTPTMVFLFLFIPCILRQYKHHPEAGKDVAIKEENKTEDDNNLLVDVLVKLL
jgi:hypothetical protein